MLLIIGWIFIAIFIFLAAVEITRFRRARRDPDEIPYPSPRLRRRLISATLFIAVVFLITYFPSKMGAWHALGLLLGILVLLVTAFVIWWRDLAETSRAVVDHARRLDEQTARDLGSVQDSASREP